MDIICFWSRSFEYVEMPFHDLSRKHEELLIPLNQLK